MVLNRDNVQAPVLPKETHECSALGGSVVVRGLLLRERLALFDDARSGMERYGHVSSVLASCVCDVNGKPILTAEQWEEFGSANFEASLDLFRVAQRLSGLDVEERKKN